MSVVAANAGALVVGLPGRLGRACELVAEADALADEIADRLHACRAGRRVREQTPCLGGQSIGFAIAAAEQKDQRLFRQILEGDLLRLRSDVVHPAPIVNDAVGKDTDVADRRDDSATPVSEAVATGNQCYPGIGHQVGRHHGVVQPTVQASLPAVKEVDVGGGDAVATMLAGHDMEVALALRSAGW